MAVRNFDGSDDVISWSIGGLSAMTFGTFATIVKLDTITSVFPGMLGLHTSGGTQRVLLYYDSGATNWTLFLGVSGAFNATGTTPAAGTWYLVVVRKATGSATARWSVRNMTSGVWSHSAASAAMADWSSPGAGGIAKVQYGSSNLLDGKLAIQAAWSNEVHWAADSGGDTALEAAGLHSSAQNWVDETPDALWLFNQDPLANVDDIVGDADQSAVTGTDVITGDDPPGFDFSLGTFKPVATFVAG